MDDPSNTLTPPKTPIAPLKKESASAQLERLSCAIVHALNAKDYDFKSSEAQEVLTHISPQWKGEMDTNVPRERPITWEEQVENWKTRGEEFPETHFEIKEVSSQVSERSGVAKVYMEMEVTGIGGVTLHAMNELRWRKVEGIWKLHYTLGMRGSPTNAGMP